jgi:hypothetical protein
VTALDNSQIESRKKGLACHLQTTSTLCGLLCGTAIPCDSAWTNTSFSEFREVSSRMVRIVAGAK